MRIIGGHLWLALGVMFLGGGASPTTIPATRVVEIDARGPWCIDGPALKDLKPAGDDPHRLVATLTGKGGWTTLVRCCPASVADLSRRWPLALARPFDVTADVQFDAGPGGERPTWSLYWKDALWRFHATAARPADGPCRLSLPAENVDDLVEMGVAFYWPGEAQPKNGSVSIRIDQLAIRTSARHDWPRPSEGKRIETLGPGRTWRSDDVCLGVTSVTHKDGHTLLNCEMDSLDRRRWHGGAWIDVAGVDFSRCGVFATMRAPAGFVCRNNTGCSLSVGLRDADGNVFWSEGEGFMAADEPTTVGLYPEMRFPLPLTFCSERFDPRRVTAVGVRIQIDDRNRVTFARDVTVDDVRIVAMPDDLRTKRDAVAGRIGRENWMSTIAARAAQKKAAPVPIGEFIENIGVDLPWPKDVFPSVGGRTWNPSHGGVSACREQLAKDFEYLAAHHIRMVRVFIFGDCLTGIVTDERGRLAIDSMVLPDIRVLLDVAERFKSLRLVPVLFDFHMADGIDRNGLALVGEHPDWVTSAARRAELFDAVQPAIDLLCSHEQVAFIDLMNEPEHAAGVGIDDVRTFLTELAVRVHRHPKGTRCTVGSATAIYAPFWLSTGIDFATCHWFDTIDPSHPLGRRSAALDPNASIMTEVDPRPDMAASLTTLWQEGFRGAWFWSLNAGDQYKFRGPPAETLKRWVETHGR